ncbi:poliovirus receptor-like [Sorex fumeus]|uniref:poliovirus receptor-like n=1 Tax=Sorex fumeus TaxID=62283 RepID=UPI0024ADCA5E|nr:poliovirus receptor-like [Sorex fumeus]
MARVPALALLWPPLLLALTLMGAPTEAGIEKVTVQAPSQVHGFVGDNVTLPCKLLSPESKPPKVTQITWMRREASGDLSRVAVFHPVQGSHIPESDRVEFLGVQQGTDLLNASIMVRGLRAQDEANYTCEIATFPRGSGSKHIWLRVFSRPQNEAESLLVEQSPKPVPMARCISSGGRPSPRISWVPDLGGKINESQEHLYGTVTVTSVLILTPSSQEDGKTVTCQVEHETLDTPARLPVNLSVHWNCQLLQASHLNCS